MKRSRFTEQQIISILKEGDAGESVKDVCRRHNLSPATYYNIDTSIPSGRVVRTLEQISRWRGLPEAIRCDNGPEIVSQVFVDWCEANDVEIRYIQPGKPNQNAYIERFNRTYREEVLDSHLFDNLNDVRELTYRWLEIYNEVRPHDALGRVPPSVFRRRLEEPDSTFELST